MARVSSFRDLVVWQRGVDLVRDVYLLTAKWPAEERYGLTSQVRRAAVSVPANIAEGQGRQGRAELRRALSIAHGSLCELETHLEVAKRLDFPDPDATDRLLDRTGEVGRLLRGLIASIDRQGAGASQATRIDP